MAQRACEKVRKRRLESPGRQEKGGILHVSTLPYSTRGDLTSTALVTKSSLRQLKPRAQGSRYGVCTRCGCRLGLPAWNGKDGRVFINVSGPPRPVKTHGSSQAVEQLLPELHIPSCYGLAFSCRPCRLLQDMRHPDQQICFPSFLMSPDASAHLLTAHCPRQWLPSRQCASIS